MSYSRINDQLGLACQHHETAIQIETAPDHTKIIAHTTAPTGLVIQLATSPQSDNKPDEYEIEAIESDFVFIPSPAEHEEESSFKKHASKNLNQFILEDYDPVPSPHEEIQPLLPVYRPPQCKKVYDFSYILKGSARIVCALLFSATNGIFSLVMLSGKSPDQISRQWWNDMSTTKKVFSIVLALSAELVNAEVNAAFFNEVLERLQTNLHNCTKSVRHAINNLLSLLCGIGGGISAGALAYEAFSWLPGVVYVFTAFNTLIYLISRYLGMNKFIERVLDRDIANLQRDVADKASLLKPQFSAQLDSAIAEKIQVLLANHASANDFGDDGLPHLNAADFDVLFETLGNKLADIAQHHPDCFDEKNKSDEARALAVGIFDATLAAVMALMSFMVFTTKGQLGIQLLLNLIMGLDISKLQKPYNAAIGSVGGTPSGCLYGISAYDFRQLLTDASRYLLNHPKELPEFFLRLSANVAAATGMYGVGAGLPGPDNLFGIKASPLVSRALGLGSGLAVFAVNMGPTLKKFTEPTPTVDPNYQDVAQHFHNPALRRIKRTTADALKQHSLFQVTKSNRSAEMSSANRLDASFVLV